MRKLNPRFSIEASFRFLNGSLMIFLGLLTLSVSLGCQNQPVAHLTEGEKKSCCENDLAPPQPSGDSDSSNLITNYEIPNVTLKDQFGESRNLKQLLNSEKPIALNFIFTTCTTICPVMTTSFKGFQKELKTKGSDTQLISISLDPEFDTPEKLSKYASRYQADSNWLFLTGTAGDMRQVHNAFHALTGSKFNHKPFTLFRNSKQEKWHRVEGLLGIEKLIEAHEIVLKEAS